jgi:hypothetical protein
MTIQTVVGPVEAWWLESAMVAAPPAADATKPDGAQSDLNHGTALVGRLPNEGLEFDCIIGVVDCRGRPPRRRAKRKPPEGEQTGNPRLRNLLQRR